MWPFKKKEVKKQQELNHMQQFHMNPQPVSGTITRTRPVFHAVDDGNDMLTGMAVGGAIGGAKGMVLGAAFGGVAGGIIGGEIAKMDEVPTPEPPSFSGGDFGGAGAGGSYEPPAVDQSPSCDTSSSSYDSSSSSCDSSGSSSSSDF